MAAPREPSTTDLVYEVMREAGRPLAVAEVVEAVNARRPIATKNPTATVRSALGQGKQLVSLGDGQYGYLPHLLRGSVLRQPLSGKKPANTPLIFPDEVRHALWPSYLEIAKRTDRRPVNLRLPDGATTTLSLEGFGGGEWGSPVSERLRRYLADCRASDGDALLIRAIDPDLDVRYYEAWFEPRRKRDAAAIAKRNEQLAAAAEEILRRNRSYETPIWDLVIALLGRGVYKDKVAPDPLAVVLTADPRFTPASSTFWILTEYVTPEVQEHIRRLEEIDAHFLDLRSDPLAGLAPPAVGPLDGRRAMERMMADVGALLSGQQFGSIDEVNAFLQQHLAAGGVPQRAAETPLEQAQDLMYQAWEQPNPQQRVHLAQRALALSPDCADAYVLLAEETARGPREAADLYAKGVTAGRRALGESYFREHVGHFWGMIETRPYMRARLGLAQALWALHRQSEAIDHAQELLHLNPGDNQGVRYLLLGWLLEENRDEEIKPLLEQYPDDAVASWAYGRALVAYRTDGDTARARKLLTDAEACNPFVPSYLLGRKRLPKRLPDYVGFGDESEAIVCASEQLTAWRRTPGALDWLRSRSSKTA